MKKNFYKGHYRRVALVFFLLAGAFNPGYSQSTKDQLRVWNPILITAGYGPEDIVIDSITNPPRLLVSCSSRRPNYPSYGEIESINPSLGTRTVMKRTGEPDGLNFKPHGISIIAAGEIQYLYVISHDDNIGEHPIIRYQIEGDHLIFVELLNSKLLVSPNALQAYRDGSLFVCNDATIRNSMKEKIFKKKAGNILHYDGRGNWTIIADKLGMPCGLTGFGDHIYVSATLENRLYSYRLTNGQLSDKATVCKIKGPDNIRLYKGNLLITSHTKPVKFILHTKKKSRISPSLVLKVDLKTGRTSRIFYDSGKLLSAASVAVAFNNQLVIGQIFEPAVVLISLSGE
jgi:hypothetical protein